MNKLIKTIIFSGLIVGGIVGLGRNFKRKPLPAKYYAQTSDWYRKHNAR